MHYAITRQCRRPWILVQKFRWYCRQRLGTFMVMEVDENPWAPFCYIKSTENIRKGPKNFEFPAQFTQKLDISVKYSNQQTLH